MHKRRSHADGEYMSENQMKHKFRTTEFSERKLCVTDIADNSDLATLLY